MNVVLPTRGPLGCRALGFQWGGELYAIALSARREIHLHWGARIFRLRLEGVREPLTVAIRVCGCGLFLGVIEWRGKDAHEGQPYTVTHGMCDDCAGICATDTEKGESSPMFNDDEDVVEVIA